jgi:hypothetical protein
LCPLTLERIEDLLYRIAQWARSLLLSRSLSSQLRTPSAIRP